MTETVPLYEQVSNTFLWNTLNHCALLVYPFDAHCCHMGTAIKHPCAILG